jgi:hypothetical protein
MEIIRKKATLIQLQKLAGERFGDMVKAVVDVERKIMAVDGELHADEEALLLEDGSCQKDLWGINLYPDLSGPDWLEYDSMINLRPSQGNRSRGVDDPAVKELIRQVVEGLVVR